MSAGDGRLDPRTIARRLAADRRHGASELGVLALEMLADLAARVEATEPPELDRALRRAAETVRRARPSMAPVQNLLDAWLERWSAGGRAGQPVAAARERAIRIASALEAEVDAAKARAVAHAARLIGPGQTVLTHSLSSTVLAVYRAVAARGIRAVVTESRPLLEGRETAAALAAAGIETEYITDAQLGIFVPQADVVLVGADSVSPDGAVSNKAGTCLAALAARAYRRPFYACFESYKAHAPGRPGTGPAGSEAAEENPPEEIAGPDLPGVRVRNVYFDRTPPHLISAWITERGISRRWPPPARPTP